MSTLATLATVRRSWDADAGAYIKAVESADQQQLEPMVAQAINQFVLGCKADGIWSAIKASCILMGARTLTGALTPLAGTAPTNVNFVSGDYDRKTGLKGNGSTKYLDSGRSNNADGQNDQHLSVYIQAKASGQSIFLGAGTSTNVASNLLLSANYATRSRNGTLLNAGAATTGFFGKSRSSSSGYAVRQAGTDYSFTQASGSPVTDKLFVFCRSNPGNVPATYTDARLAFYSIGAALTLSSLETRASNLYTAIGAAIA